MKLAKRKGLLRFGSAGLEYVAFDKTTKAKKVKNRNFTVINDADPNETFEVSAKDVNEAQYLALTELGWWISES